MIFYLSRNPRNFLLFFRSAQEITITQHNKSKLFSASFNLNFPTDYIDLHRFWACDGTATMGINKVL